MYHHLFVCVIGWKPEMSANGHVSDFCMKDDQYMNSAVFDRLQKLFKINQLIEVNF